MRWGVVAAHGNLDSIGPDRRDATGGLPAVRCLVGGTGGRWLKGKHRFLSDLAILKQLIEAGTMTPVVARLPSPYGQPTASDPMGDRARVHTPSPRR